MRSDPDKHPDMSQPKEGVLIRAALLRMPPFGCPSNGLWLVDSETE